MERALGGLQEHKESLWPAPPGGIHDPRAKCRTKSTPIEGGKRPTVGLVPSEAVSRP